MAEPVSIASDTASDSATFMTFPIIAPATRPTPASARAIEASAAEFLESLSNLVCRMRRVKQKIVPICIVFNRYRDLARSCFRVLYFDNNLR
jgi:hypothetical protein